jgi:3-deoxy-D-manno-octulosonate 8-phosphate phosphatase (KDO 8-P phosphatase)
LDSSVSSISSVSVDADAVAAVFRELGGVFLTPPTVLAQRIAALRGLAFDWDGVFNLGVKGEGSHSTFSEADSMGTNLLRFALWRRDGVLPASAIITGEHNLSARRFATRENFDLLYQGVKDKSAAMDEFCRGARLARGQVMCAFDDVNDLAMAADCGVRMLIRRRSSPLFQRYVSDSSCVDYVTAHEPSGHAVREICELILGLMGAFDAVVEARVAFAHEYREYWTQRQSVTTQLVRR